MIKHNGLNKIGIIGFVIAIASIILLNYVSTADYANKGQLLFNFIIIIANIGLFLFAAIGIYFWVHFFKKINKQLNPWGLAVYLCLSIISGYWAYAKYNKIHS